MRFLSIFLTLFFASSVLVASASAEVELTWTDNSENEDGFYIEGRVYGSDDWARVAEVGKDVTTAKVSSEVNGEWRVQAFNKYGKSGYTNIDGVTPADPSDTKAERPLVRFESGDTIVEIYEKE